MERQNNKVKKETKKNILREKTIENYKSILNIWINHFKINDEKWILTNHQKVYEYIKKKYDNIGTFRCHLNFLIKILKKYDKNIIKNKEYIAYKKIYVKISEKINKLKGKQKPDDKFITFEEIVNKRNEFYKELCNEKNKNIKLMYKWLILCLFTMKEPLRNQYYDMKIIHNKKNIDKTKNYLFIKNDKMFVLIYFDKTSDKYGKANFELSKNLCEIINISLKIYPRSYLFASVDDNTKNIDKKSFYDLRTDMFKGKNLTIHNLRSAYISYIYRKNPNININEMKDLSVNMRHDVISQITYYKKIYKNKIKDPENINITISEIQKIPTDFCKINEIITQNINNDDKTQLNNRKNFKNHYDKNKEKILKRKILYTLNSGKVKEPSKESIAKYDLFYNNKTKKWT